MAPAARDEPPPPREWFAQIVRDPWENGTQNVRFIGIDPLNAEPTTFATFRFKRKEGTWIRSFTRTGHLIETDHHMGSVRLRDYRGRLLDTWDLKMKEFYPVGVSPDARTWFVSLTAYVGRSGNGAGYLIQGTRPWAGGHMARLQQTDWDWSAWCWTPPWSWSPDGRWAAFYYARDSGGDIGIQDYGLAKLSLSYGIEEFVQPPGWGTPHTQATTLPPRWGPRGSHIYYTGPRSPDERKERFPHTRVCVYRVRPTSEKDHGLGQQIALGRLVSIAPDGSYLLVDQYPVVDEAGKTERRTAKIMLPKGQVEVLPKEIREPMVSPSGQYVACQDLSFYRATDWSPVSRFEGKGTKLGSTFGQPPGWIRRIPVESVASVSPYDDVRWADLSKLDLSDRPELIETLWFSHETTWPPSGAMPERLDPIQLLSKAKNPGLGVASLHARGITGKDVTLAMIGYPMHFALHPDVAGRIMTVRQWEYGTNASQRLKLVMRGPAAASLAVGKDGGIAPDGRLWYAEVPWNETDGSVYAKALDWLREKSDNGLYIRVVAMAAAPVGEGLTTHKEAWRQAVARAEAANMIVVALPALGGWVGPCWYDANSPEDPWRCRPGLPDGSVDVADLSGLLLAPAGRRTAACEYDLGHFGFQYCGPGCPEWAMPYCAGVLALGCQVAPELPGQRLKQLLIQSACKTPDGLLIIQPTEFIELVQKAVETKPAIQ